MKKYKDVAKELEKIDREIEQNNEEILRLLEDEETDDDEEEEVPDYIYEKVKAQLEQSLKPEEKPRRKGLFVETIASFAMIISLIYTIYKFFAYNQLHLRAVVVFVVSIAIVMIVERFNK